MKPGLKMVLVALPLVVLSFVHVVAIAINYVMLRVERWSGRAVYGITDWV